MSTWFLILIACSFWTLAVAYSIKRDLKEIKIFLYELKRILELIGVK